MPEFKYRAKDVSGARRDGVVEAPDKDELIRSLLAEGLYVYEVREEHHRGDRGREDGQTFAAPVGQGCLSAALGNLIPFVSLGELAVVTRELATAFGAGLDLIHAVAAVREGQLSPLMRRAFRDMSDYVAGGYPLHEAMERHPRIFNRMYVGMVRVGEGSGTLDEILKNLAEMFEEEVELRRRIQGMLVYPAFVVAVMLIATFILGWIGIMPMWMFWSIVRVLGILFLIWLIHKNRYVSAVSRTVLSVLPGIGNLIRRISVARIAFSLGTMIKSGVPYLQAIEWTQDSANLPVMDFALKQVYRDVADGMTLSESLSRRHIFPPMARNVLAVGETAGSVDASLFKIYEYLRSEINYQTRSLVAAMGPVLILILAVAVGYIVITFWSGYFGYIMKAVGD